MLFDHHGLTLSSLSFYDNNLHPDPAERAAINKHVAACIDAAALLGVSTVGTFVGRDPSNSDNSVRGWSVARLVSRESIHGH